MKRSKADKITDAVICAAFFLFALMMIYPIWYVLIGAFNEGLDYTAGGVYLLPRKFSLDNFQLIFADVRLWNAYGITVSRTVLGTLTALLFTSFVSYGMSRPELPFKRFFFWANIFTMFFGGGLVPFFLIIKTLGLYDNYLLYIIPCAYSVYHMIIISNCFRSLPNDLHESAMVDGASEFRVYMSIYMPLSKPTIATVALWVAIGHWNSYFDTMVYTSNKSLWTLQFYMLKLINSASIPSGVTLPAEVFDRLTPQSVTYAAIIVSIIPVLLLFPFLSKYFEKGIMIGSLKG
ncbi:sugar ABC transporter permease [Clostridia bacterium]|nr:sugar ABC transporter permease [Clostridia bacterium]